MKQGIIIDSKTGQQKGELVCDIFPRKRGYEVVCVLQKTGKEPTFASHGVYMNKPAAENAIEHVFGAMRSNPIRTFVITIQDKVKLRGRHDPEDFERYFTINAKSKKAAIKALRDSGIYNKIIEIQEESRNPLVESIITGAGLGIGLFGVRRLFNERKNPVLKKSKPVSLLGIMPSKYNLPTLTDDDIDKILKMDLPTSATEKQRKMAWKLGGHII